MNSEIAICIITYKRLSKLKLCINSIANQATSLNYDIIIVDNDSESKIETSIYEIAQEKKLSKLISSLPSGILVTFEGTDDHRLSEEQYEAVCNATKIVSQRSVMGANLTNFKAKHIYTINGNDIKETFVKWDKEKNKCFAGFTVTGSNVGVNETITVSGEVLSFFNTGIDTRVYFIKNF